MPAPLIADIADGRCLPFVGAGFSLNAKSDGVKMPDWPVLARILASAAGVDTEIQGPDAASAFERKFGRVHLIDAIRERLTSRASFQARHIWRSYSCRSIQFTQLALTFCWKRRFVRSADHTGLWLASCNYVPSYSNTLIRHAHNEDAVVPGIQSD
jgi:hypothetical protein